VIRHVSLLTFVDTASDDQIAAIERALHDLPERLPIRAYAIGRDLALNEGNADFAVVADFDDIGDYFTYRDDREHQRILTELIRPILASRTAVQYEVSSPEPGPD
jgi:Stress responsive A/B Barrel Domain